MTELSILEMIKYAIKAFLDSKVIVLLVLEGLILLVSFVFSKLMDKRVVKTTSIFASLTILGFYITNYVGTIKVFIDNISTQIVELIYFPSTLEFFIVMSISVLIMLVTLLRKKSSTLMKVINTSVPIAISFLFLCIIEYINTNEVAFDEFSVFTNPALMSLYELAMGVFISWIILLLVIKVDKLIINHVTLPKLKEETSLVTVDLSQIEEEEEIELPRLKSEIPH